MTSSQQPDDRDGPVRPYGGWRRRTTPTPGPGVARHIGPHLPTQPPGSQPTLGLAGLTFVVPFFFLFAFALGSAERSLLVLGPLTTFALPVIATVAFWWQDWPGSRLRPGWSGLTDTLVIAASAIALTLLGQAVTSQVDLHGVFSADPGPGHPPTFPVTLALGAGAFTVLLHLTLVCEGRPIRRLGWFWGGTAALLLSLAISVAAYLLLVNLDDVPAALRTAERLRNPQGPLPAAAYSALLLILGVWQVMFFVALRGWPFTLLRHPAVRLAAGNATIAASAAASFLLVWSLAGVGPDRINAVGGTVIASALLVSMLFDGWPASRLHPGPGRLVTLLLIVLVAAVLYAALSSYATQIHWRRASADAWVALSALNFLALGVVLHVAVWRRWPVVPGADQANQPR
ncbi:hypothetical protein [Plantactinospora endophytica]|uniref:Uncharacterized protein n=1 Tax=Plantactinospora endophytica TaxID=673535 RepID=A0ABQ4EB74_9ACTN|nr:hypothetical protein [Plantactinospora endophytica]GIG91990.1 hypothetical protein Pen02_69260 [Plantactinospora endophytica]